MFTIYRQFTLGGGWREGEGVYCLTPPPHFLYKMGGGGESIKIQNGGGGVYARAHVCRVEIEGCGCRNGNLFNIGQSLIKGH